MPKAKSTLEYKTPTDVKTGFKNDGVARALKLMGNTTNSHDDRRTQWESIQDLYEDSFAVYNPKGKNKMKSKLLPQVVWRTVNKMKPLDFTVHGVGVDENMEHIVMRGIATVLAEGGYDACLRNKNGAFYTSAIFGDSFMRMGTSDTGFPVQFSMASLTDVYVDEKCTDVRDKISGNECNEMVVIYRYSWDQYQQIQPNKHKNVAPGEIPRNRNTKQLAKKFRQENYEQEPYIEEAHYYNKGAKRHTVFAGSSATVIQDLKGESYPFMIGDEPFIPVLHYKFIPSTEGFYNHGLGHMFYDMAINQRRLNNMAINQVEDNVYPLTIFNVPKGEESKFFGKMYDAHRQRSVGAKGYIVNELSPANPNARTQIESLQTPPLTSEYERMKQQFDIDINRLGVQIDSVDRGGNITATQILAEEENADAFIKQVMEVNASEYKFAIEATISMLREAIDAEDPTPLHISTTVNAPNGQEVEIKNITLGELAEELRTNEYYVTINSRSGAIPSNVMMQTQITRALAAVPPGSPASLKLTRKFLQLNDQDISMEELMGQPERPDLEAIENVEPAQTEEVKALPAAQAGEEVAA